MRFVILIFCLFSAAYINAQIKVPAGFRLVKGESPVGREDYYEKGNYRIFMDSPFQADGTPSDTDDEKRALLTDIYGIAFRVTKDGIIYGTGYTNKKFYYIVVGQGASFLVSSPLNDTGFSNYSAWLMNSIRSALKSGKELYFE